MPKYPRARPAASDVGLVRAKKSPQEAPLAYLRRASVQLGRRYSGDRDSARKLTAVLQRVEQPDDVGAAIEAHRRLCRFAVRSLRDDGCIEEPLPGLIRALSDIIESQGFICYACGCWWKRFPLLPEGT